MFLIHFSETLLYEIDMLCMCPRRKMETSCKTYFMSGKIKELKKKSAILSRIPINSTTSIPLLLFFVTKIPRQYFSQSYEISNTD